MQLSAILTTAVLLGYSTCEWFGAEKVEPDEVAFFHIRGFLDEIPFPYQGCQRVIA